MGIMRPALADKDPRFVPEGPPLTEGMAVVQKAIEVYTKAVVALKGLHECDVTSERKRDDLRWEYDAQSVIHHRAVVRARELVECPEDGPVLVFDWIEAKTMGEWLEDRYDEREQTILDPNTDKNDVRTIFRLLSTASRGLEEAHRIGIVHRDVKPLNIFVNAGPVLFDWGLASVRHHVDPERCPGTPFYMSPEIARNEEANAYTDIFGIGATMYDALTGMPPYLDTHPDECVLRAARSDYVPVSEVNPAVPPEVAVVCMGAMHPDRYQRTPLPVFRRQLRELLGKLRD